MRSAQVGLAFLAVTAVASPAVAADAEPICRVVEVSFTPTHNLQIVVWLETANGEFVDTLLITQATGTHGIANRPGMMEFNSANWWPYGRRTTVAPVWAHRHGMQWPLVLFQDEDDRDLSHPFGQSSPESHYCRPLRPDEFDALACASTAVFTDKGKASATQTSRYPPRADVLYIDGIDHPDAEEWRGMNPFDAISRATPPGNARHSLVWPTPVGLPDGDYVLFVEASAEWDQNAFYDYPAPTGIPWSDYGLPSRGQPSVVYQVPFTLTAGVNTAMTESYAGYGDPDGLDGILREPDGTITENVDGSGASRMLLTVDGDGTYRVKVQSRPSDDDEPPGPVGDLAPVEITTTAVTAQFVAPGSDDNTGMVSGYEIRIQAGTPITEDNFADAPLASVSVAPELPGTLHELTLDRLQPNTNYYIAIRAFDECLNYGPIETIHARTPREASGEVDACFVATAAFGSVMQADVAELRRFRDVALRTHVAGELAVEAYYTFGPSLAAVIRPSDTLRRMARAALAPAVRSVRAWLP